MKEQMTREEVKRKCQMLNNVAVSFAFVGGVLLILNWDLSLSALVLDGCGCALAFIGVFLIKKSEALRKKFEKNQRL